MNRVAHRLAGAVSGALVLAAVALPATTARATTQHAAPHEIVNSVTCVNPQNPVWGDGTCGP